MNTPICIFCLTTFSIILSIYFGVQLLVHMVILCFNLLRSCPTVFHSNCTILHFHQQWIRILISPHPHQHLLFSSLCFYFLYSSCRYEIVVHCNFGLHFPNDKWYWASFHMLTGHLFVFSGQISIQILCPYFWTVELLEFFIYSDNYSLSAIRLANIFSHSVNCLFPLLIHLLVHKIFKFGKVQFIYFVVAYAFGIILKKSLPNLRSWGPSHFRYEEIEDYMGKSLRAQCCHQLMTVGTKIQSSIQNHQFLKMLKNYWGKFYLQ